MNPVRNNLHSPCPWFIGMGFFTSDKEFDPNKEWPETQWQKVEGRFILAASDGYAVGETGGEEKHKLTETEMPKHSHAVTAYINYNWFVKTTTGLGEPLTTKYQMNIPNVTTTQGSDTGRGYLGTSQAGGWDAHNNMPPYIVRVYWERIG